MEQNLRPAQHKTLSTSIVMTSIVRDKECDRIKNLPESILVFICVFSST